MAAFDHRHIFLDPDPDPATSYAERRRLFELPRSSWADYDTDLISAGGGVHLRSAKSVPVTPQVAARLGLAHGTSRMTPNELLRAVLGAPVDLLWNGGIGTYVKASTEQHADVGDKANDAIRVNGADLRATVVGEGGNLGLTQLGRIEAALHGVHLTTDAIDNSAGVDCSDHEVNIKILLDRVVAEGDLTVKHRGQLLQEMTDDVARLVLRDNYDQNVVLGNAGQQAHVMLPVHRRMIGALVAQGRLDRELEFLPSDAEMDRRAEEGIGLTSPELSVLVAYAKMWLSDAVLASDVPDDPWCHRVLAGYFPDQLVERFESRLAAHPLRREIITAQLVNDLVARGGITFAFRAAEETGVAADQVVRAYVISREVFGQSDYMAAVEALDTVVPTAAQAQLQLAFRRLLDRSVRWLLTARPGELDVAAEVERFAPTAARLGPQLPDLLVGSERKVLHRRADALMEDGVPAELALRSAGLLQAFPLLDVTEIAASTSLPAEDVAVLYFALSERYGVDVLLARIAELERGNRWQALARGALRDDVYAAMEALTLAVLRQTPAGEDAVERIADWEVANAAQLARVGQTLEEVRRMDTGDLASLSVALRMLRGLVRSGSASS